MESGPRTSKRSFLLHLDNGAAIHAEKQQRRVYGGAALVAGVRFCWRDALTGVFNNARPFANTPLGECTHASDG